MQSKGAEAGRKHESRNDQNQGVVFYQAVPQLTRPAQKAVNAQQGEGEEAAIFFPFKIKNP